jgi:hypothetical protein
MKSVKSKLDSVDDCLPSFDTVKLATGTKLAE